ncbi:MAG: hypothetical protein PSX36_09500 [bacterium]|nr:hypothetical protein [bacterium]
MSILFSGSNTLSYYKLTQTKGKTSLSIQKKYNPSTVSGLQYLQSSNSEFLEEEVSDNDEYSNDLLLTARATLSENEEPLLTALPYYHFVKKIPLYILLHSWKTYLS